MHGGRPWGSKTIFSPVHTVRLSITQSIVHYAPYWRWSGKFLFGGAPPSLPTFLFLSISFRSLPFLWTLPFLFPLLLPNLPPLSEKWGARGTPQKIVKFQLAVGNLLHVYLIHEYLLHEYLIDTKQCARSHNAHAYTKVARVSSVSWWHCKNRLRFSSNHSKVNDIQLTMHEIQPAALSAARWRRAWNTSGIVDR